MSTFAALFTPQFLRFLVAGGIAAGANYGSRFFFSRFFGYEFSIIFAYFIGMLVAFLLMRGHVFDAKQHALLPQVVKFAGVNMLAVIQTLLISLALARWVLPIVGVINDDAEALAHW